MNIIKKDLSCQISKIMICNDQKIKKIGVHLLRILFQI